MKFHEIVVKKSTSEVQIYIRNLNTNMGSHFKSFSGGMYDILITIFHVLTWILFLSYLCYVMILRKRKGYVSRSLKESTMFRPYLFQSDDGLEDELSR